MKIRLGTRLLDDKILKKKTNAISCRELFLQTELSLASITREIQSGSESTTSFSILWFSSLLYSSQFSPDVNFYRHIALQICMSDSEIIH